MRTTKIIFVLLCAALSTHGSAIERELYKDPPPQNNSGETGQFRFSFVPVKETNQIIGYKFSPKSGESTNRLGLLPGDTILKIDGIRAANGKVMARMFGKLMSEDLALEILRNGVVLEVTTSLTPISQEHNIPDMPKRTDNNLIDSETAVLLQENVEKCYSNNMNSCRDVSVYYQSVNDPKRVWRYHEKACTGRLALACTELGYMFTQGENLLLDSQAGRYYYAKACDLGDKSACEFIGWNSEKDITCVNANNPTECRIVACDSEILGHICLMVGIDYINGTRTAAKNEMLAADYFRKACMLKNGNGCLNLAGLYRSGSGVTKNENTARMYYLEACMLENRSACDDLKEYTFPQSK